MNIGVDRQVELLLNAIGLGNNVFRCAVPGWGTPRHSISLRLLSTAGLVGLLAVAPGVRTGSAQSVNDMVRTLNNVLNPADAQRLEGQARRNGRPQDERYWRDYRAGLDSRDSGRPDYRERDDYRSQRDQGY